MTVHVRFRFNKRTGEVEEFLVDDQDRNLPDSEHERVALAVGQVLAVHPQLREVQGVQTVPTPPAPVPEPERTPGERQRGGSS